MHYPSVICALANPGKKIPPYFVKSLVDSGSWRIRTTFVGERTEFKIVWYEHGILQILVEFFMSEATHHDRRVHLH